MRTKYRAMTTVSMGKADYEPVGFERQKYSLVYVGQEFYADSDIMGKLLRNKAVEAMPEAWVDSAPMVDAEDEAPKKRRGKRT